ncbi:MAG: Na+/H+ antiporter NhaA [Sphingobacteriaceae bacterium]
MKRTSRIQKKVINFFHSEPITGIILIYCVILSMIIANSAAGPAFEKLLNYRMGWEAHHLNYSTITWINDGLMAIFFLYVGLEIKRELIQGELSSLKQASLPFFAAIGGMALPAFLYFLYNRNTVTASGWGIPMATDIAFAIAILSILGKRVLNSHKIFLKALAIVDDLGAILVIAIFYTANLNLQFIYLAAAVFALQLFFNRIGLKHAAFYLVPGLLLWYFIHSSGIHATIAGVLTAFTIPMKNDKLQNSTLEKLERRLNKPVNFMIMPLFAIANTNISLDYGMLHALMNPLSLGIMSGLLLGKPFGILGFSYLAVKLRLSKLPENSRWIQILGLGVLGGIGFTMSIFIALLSFNDPVFQIEAKFTILLTSVIASICGYLILIRLGKKMRIGDKPIEF